MHKPLRMCMVCRARKEKGQLLKVVKNKNGELFLDAAHKMPGRGAYVCLEGACREKARRAKALERAFKGPCGAQIYDELERF